MGDCQSYCETLQVLKEHTMQTDGEHQIPFDKSGEGIMDSIDTEMPYDCWQVMDLDSVHYLTYGVRKGWRLTGVIINNDRYDIGESVLENRTAGHGSRFKNIIDFLVFDPMPIRVGDWVELIGVADETLPYPMHLLSDRELLHLSFKRWRVLEIGLGDLLLGLTDERLYAVKANRHYVVKKLPWKVGCWAKVIPCSSLQDVRFFKVLDIRGGHLIGHFSEERYKHWVNRNLVGQRFVRASREEELKAQTAHDEFTKEHGDDLLDLLDLDLDDSLVGFPDVLGRDLLYLSQLATEILADPDEDFTLTGRITVKDIMRIIQFLKDQQKGLDLEVEGSRVRKEEVKRANENEKRRKNAKEKRFRIF